MTQIDINKPKNEALAEEIRRFLTEMEEIMRTSKMVTHSGRFKFDAFLFLAWRK